MVVLVSSLSSGKHSDMKISLKIVFVSPPPFMVLDDFRWLATDLVSRPTRIAELIPDREPATNGACDAAAAGMGGAHFVPTDTTEIPLL